MDVNANTVTSGAHIESDESICIKGKIDFIAHVIFSVGGEIPAATVRSGGDISVEGGINGQSNVNLEAKGSITIDGWIDGKSQAKLQAKGQIAIHGKIDGKSQVELQTEGQITIHGKIDGKSQVVVPTCSQMVVTDKIDGQSWLSVRTTGGVLGLFRKIDGQSSIEHDCPITGGKVGDFSGIVNVAHGSTVRSTVNDANWNPHFRPR